MLMEVGSHSAWPWALLVLWPIVPVVGGILLKVVRNAWRETRKELDNGK